MSQYAKKITTYAMFCALAFIMAALIEIPLVLFLKYEPKDVVITIAGFLYGPLATIIISFVVAFVEMITISTDGVIGFVMNIISTVAFAGTASIIYKRKPSLKSVALGLMGGTVLMTILMMLWNYFLTPIYMGTPREAVVELLIPAFLPFNLIKGGINAVLVMLIYNPIKNILRKTNILTDIESTNVEKVKRKKTGIIVFFFFILVMVVLMSLSLQGLI